MGRMAEVKVLTAAVLHADSPGVGNKVSSTQNGYGYPAIRDLLHLPAFICEGKVRMAAAGKCAYQVPKPKIVFLHETLLCPLCLHIENLH